MLKWEGGSKKPTESPKPELNYLGCCLFERWKDGPIEWLPADFRERSVYYGLVINRAPPYQPFSGKLRFTTPYIELLFDPDVALNHAMIEAELSPLWLPAGSLVKFWRWHRRLDRYGFKRLRIWWERRYLRRLYFDRVCFYERILEFPWGLEQAKMLAFEKRDDGYILMFPVKMIEECLIEAGRRAHG